MGVNHARAFLLELRSARHVAEGAYRAVGRLHGARAVHVRVHVSGQRAAAIAQLDHFERAEHGACMVPVAVRQHERFDAAHVEPQPLDVAFENPVVWRGVEEQRTDRVAARSP